jgi:hypothetical protein
LGGTNIPPRDEGGGRGLDFHEVPKQFPSITHQYAFGFIKFSNNSHQIALVPINNPSKSFVLIKFSSNPFCSHQVLIKILLFPQLPLVPNPTLHKLTQSSKFCERLGQSAKRSAPVPGQARKGSYSDRQTSVWCGRAESGDFVPARFCGRPRADLLLARQSAALLPSCACAITRNERV